ncbi:hypothetical protein GCM10007870_22640 [Gluconobacter kondonii]|uniref:Transposase n=1 Tax=Gluconobacter kondonii TaxID=941463 RepID=A0ABQ5WTG0_9PROT|nr:hypothetical protein AA3266_2626 [Gluconobacter kondonii NBRC 3266]GLQ66679.1 hypothetical protein GCM10007870_22640 [Gluconobacter kondonii]
MQRQNDMLLTIAMDTIITSGAYFCIILDLTGPDNDTAIINIVDEKPAEAKSFFDAK